jgi:oligopeptide transport system permease protein
MDEKEALSYWYKSCMRLKANPGAMFGCVVLVALIGMAIFGPLFSPYSYYDIHLHEINSPPSALHLFGTDELGRDIFTRICFGARISLSIGVIAALLDLLVGVTIGSLAGACGGLVDEITMRIADSLHSIPYLLIVIMLMVTMGSGIWTILLALTITGWIGMARIVRGQIIQLKTLDYVKAAEALGATKRRILLRHLLPNAVGPIIATMTLTIPSAIFTESFLSFLGLGIQAPSASWGTMASDGLPAMRYFPWRLFMPAGFISLTMLSFNLLGDGLRDAFDPRCTQMPLN